MWTSKQDRDTTVDGHRPALATSPVVRFLGALTLCALVALAPDRAATRGGALLDPNPLWIAVAILAARYGAGGLFAGVAAGVAVVGFRSVLAGVDPRDSLGRLESAANLMAFGACLAVSWIASWHLRRKGRLEERIQALSDREAESSATIEALRDVASTLRARVDRASTSITFLRDVASRLDGRDAVAAAEAAADLALARTGAHAAAIHVGANASQRLLAVRDARYPQALAPLDFRSADRKVSIRSGNERIGVLSIWGLPRSDRDEAMDHDLAVIASWCAGALVLAPLRRESETPRALRAS